MTNNNWISVKDRLPEEEEARDYLVMTHCGRDIAAYDKIKGWEVWNVTHWHEQPLPEPPVAEQEADHD